VVKAEGAAEGVGVEVGVETGVGVGVDGVDGEGVGDGLPPVIV